MRTIIGFLALFAVMCTTSFAQGYHHKMQNIFTIAGVKTDMNAEQVKNTLENNGFSIKSSRKGGTIKAKKSNSRIRISFTGDLKQITNLEFQELDLSSGAVEDTINKIIQRFGSKYIKKVGRTYLVLPSRKEWFTKNYIWECDSDRDCSIKLSYGQYERGWSRFIKLEFVNRIAAKNFSKQRRIERMKEREKNTTNNSNF